MPGKAHFYRPDKPVEVEDLTTTPKLEYLQKAVGGYIEAIPGFTKLNGEPCVAFCDEEGKLKGKPYNAAATQLWTQCFKGPIDDVLVGDILVLTGDKAFMRKL